jgi:hypothetical protein
MVVTIDMKEYMDIDYVVQAASYSLLLTDVSEWFYAIL